VPTVRGCRERLLQVMEHLVDNAAQAISDAGVRDNEEHAIRISVAHDEHTLNLIVSDTGTGFEEPGRAFDPFYTTRDPVEGAGMGLSICYGIVREHRRVQPASARRGRRRGAAAGQNRGG
jgi:C4-dicarboxylate-specific signal transduction histidine kinase